MLKPVQDPAYPTSSNCKVSVLYFRTGCSVSRCLNTDKVPRLTATCCGACKMKPEDPYTDTDTHPGPQPKPGTRQHLHKQRERR